MNKRKRLLMIAGVLVVSLFNCLFFLRINASLEHAQEFFAVIKKVNDIPPKLEELKTEIWNVVYRPDVPRDVINRRSQKYKNILRDISKDLGAARDYSTQEKPLAFIERASRVINSLARKVDLLSVNRALQKMDMDSTKVFFQDSGSTSMLSGSYVAEMEEIMKKIDSMSDVVDDNIAQYSREQVIISSQTNERDTGEFGVWIRWATLLNAGFLIACLWDLLV